MYLSEIGEFTKAVAPMFTACAACVGAWIAWRGLSKWHAETVGKRRAELAEQTLIAFYEARDVFFGVRIRGLRDGEGESRPKGDGENASQQKKRDQYYAPIERLTCEKEVFARLQTLRYAFAAHYGDQTKKSFEAIREVHDEIIGAANILIQMAPDDADDSHEFRQDVGHAFNIIGWGQTKRPDDIDRKIESAVREIEEVCRPVLSEKASIK